MTRHFHGIAAWIAFIIPLFLIGGALISQHLFGLAPCDMCYWQRWPHWAAIVIAVLALAMRTALVPLSRVLVWLAAISIAISGVIGGWHAGIEYGWWQGMTSCSAPLGGGGNLSSQEMMDAIMNAPVVRCDQVQWSLFGISMAGYNFLISIGSALVIAVLLRLSRKHALPGAEKRARAEAERLAAQGEAADSDVEDSATLSGQDD